MNLRRYRAIVVGATGGIGNAITRAIAPHCDALLLVGRNGRGLEGLAQEIACAVSFVAADIATVAGRAAVVEAARRMAGVDLVVNSAGTTEFAWLADQSDEAVERIVVTNLLAPMQLARRLLPLLQEQSAATIVNVGSIFGYLGYPGCAAYSASKFGLRGFTEALRRELAGGPVRVMYLAPRSTRTPLNSDAQREPRRRGRRSPGGRARAAAPPCRTTPRATAGLSRGLVRALEPALARHSRPCPGAPTPADPPPCPRRRRRGHVFRAIGGNHFLRSYR